MKKDNNQQTLPFASLFGKKVVANFDGATQSSDGDLLFLREVERAIGITRRLARALRDRRHPGYVDHSLETLLESQRKVKLFTSFPYQAQSWKKPRRMVCKVEISKQGENVRFMVTSIKSRQPSFIYSTIYCARGRMEGFIKNHKRYLLSDRTSCHSFQANQFDSSSTVRPTCCFTHWQRRGPNGLRHSSTPSRTAS